MKDDVRNTLKAVCYKVLHDNSVSERVRDLRAEGLLILGEMYYNHTVDEQQSLDELVTKLGKQSGFFGAYEQGWDNASPDADGASSAAAEPQETDPLSKANIERLIARLTSEEDSSGSLSVKEIKFYLDQLHENHAHFLEKAEMKAHLLKCLLQRQMAKGNV
jgi:hypothetical protein